jgi:hypothetical protein
MNTSKIIGSCLIISCISFTTTGCNKSSSQISSIRPVSEKSFTPAEPVKPPETFDVICFAAQGMMVSRTMCDPDQTYKVPRNSDITVYLDKKSSVQGGNNTVVTFDYKNKNSTTQMQKISISEMESLASQGANIYTMAYHLIVDWQGNIPAVEVELYNKELGKFAMFDRDRTQVIFKTGEAVRVEVAPERMGDAYVRYRKISTK